jgi:hypothetical protein
MLIDSFRLNLTLLKVVTKAAKQKHCLEVKNPSPQFVFSSRCGMPWDRQSAAWMNCEFCINLTYEPLRG